jgi:hypothetical protein
MTDDAHFWCIVEAAALSLGISELIHLERIRIAPTERVSAPARARILVGVSLAWLCFEGAATTTAGLLAGSTALLGNGLNGAIEGLAMETRSDAGVAEPLAAAPFALFVLRVSGSDSLVVSERLRLELGALLAILEKMSDSNGLRDSLDPGLH